MISLRQVDKHYRSKRRTVHVVDHIDLEVPTGAFFTLLGPSGSGKSTTLRLVAGLERHEKGEIRLGDRLVSVPERRVFVPPNRRGIGMVFQSYAIWPHLDVFANVSYPLRLGGRDRPDKPRMAAQVEEALELVGLRDLKHAPATALSGGQQQRVALARALVGRPDILLLDEPLSNLDAQLRERMRVELRDIQRSLGITTLYVTHDRAEALSMSTRVAVMNRGRIEMVGTPSEIYERPSTLFIAEFLGQCNRLAGRIVERGTGGQVTVETAMGRVSCAMPPSGRPGDDVDVILRPEDIELKPLAPPAAGEAGPTGRIESGTYFGDRAELDVRLGAAALRVSAHPSQLRFVDAPVAISIHPNRAWAIPRTGPAVVQ